MPIHFAASRWEAARENARRWWAGELKRPLIHVILTNDDPGRPPARLPYKRFTAHYGLETPMENIVDACDYRLSRERYLGDAFPTLPSNFGPGIVAAFLGARVVCDDRTVWFHPAQELEPVAMNFAYDPDNAWFRRIGEFYRAALDRFEDRVLIKMTDLGGTLDILSTFRKNVNLLTDLLVNGEEIKRLTWRLHDLWWRYYEEFNAILQPRNRGYTSWAPFYSETPYYMLQCDFLYMLGPDHFDEFVKPELAASCRRLGNAFYHLDGPGQLPSLDSLLTIPDLKGVQWVPGPPGRSCSRWPEVYRKIREAGKLAQVLGGPEEFDAVVEQLGSAEGLVFVWNAPIARRTEALEFLARHGVPAGP